MQTKPPVGSRLLGDGGFASTKFLKYFWPFIVVLFIGVKYQEFIQIFWSGMKGTLKFLWCPHIMFFGPVNRTVLWIVALDYLSKYYINASVGWYGETTYSVKWCDNKLNDMVKWWYGKQTDMVKWWNYKQTHTV